MYAAKNNNIQIVNFLKQHNVDFNEEDKHGLTAFVHCLNKGSKEDFEMAQGRFYRKEHPEEGDLVVAKIVNIMEAGSYV